MRTNYLFAERHGASNNTEDESTMYGLDTTFRRTASDSDSESSSGRNYFSPVKWRYCLVPATPGNAVHPFPRLVSACARIDNTTLSVYYGGLLSAALSSLSSPPIVVVFVVVVVVVFTST